MLRESIMFPGTRPGAQPAAPSRATSAADEPTPAAGCDAAGEAVESDSAALGAVQLLLSEERTSLSLMRTGIAILALPMSVLSLLVATSRYYDALDVLGLLLPLAGLCVVLMLFGGYLILHSWRKMHRIDGLIHRIKLEHGGIAKYMEPIDSR